jgi:uncharacterized repeat protein (TIGR01451 family)
MWLRRRIPRIGALALVIVVCTPGTGQAQQYSVTLAARVCPSYEAITANLARNDIQESLRDLGPDSPYRPGQPINPDVEAGAQPQCAPLPGWELTLGRGYRSHAVDGPWGSLSIVTQPLRGATTAPEVPLLNSAGVPTGRTIAGAVNVSLTTEEVNLAGRHSLWLQGGTTTDPVLDQRYPGAYGFGALRCAIDDLNGDNVEYIAFPQGARNVFCFAYYVSPPPTSGTIVVRKEVDAPPETAANDFRLEGDLSFNPGGAFMLNAAPGRPQEKTFYRAGGVTWTVREIVEPGWALNDLGCTSRTGASSAAIPADSGLAQIALGARDTVTCTYRNGLQPPPSGLSIGKVTRGATGSTAFDIRGPALQAETTLTTEEPGVAAYENLPQLPSGDYEIDETPVERAGGRWRREQVRCGGRIVEPFTDPLELTIPAGAGISCVYVNEFVPAGAIRLRKIMKGGTGTTGFTIRPLDADPPRVYQQRAVVSRENVPVTAAGDLTSSLPIGVYDIQETTPTGGRSWVLESVTCNGIPVGSAQGRVRIRLTADEPEVTCTFLDRRTRSEPDDRGDVSPEQAGASPTTNLRVTKRVSPTISRPGEPVRYTVVVRNTSGTLARDVVAAELQPPSHRAVRIRPPRGVRCRGSRPLRCALGDLAPGERVTLRATHTTGLRGRVVNRVAVHTATAENRLSDNRARAVLRVVTPRSGACAADVYARAAC